MRVNREKVTSSSRLVRPADVLTIRLSRDVRVVRVIGFSDRRVSPAQTASLYESVSEG
ncbi:RNA-binding S4 domain-containing protein [Acuticoccus sp. M5D2P5]|nr:RNA-binding S4 domain-containing protein [Acuticoccus kalidii]